MRPLGRSVTETSPRRGRFWRIVLMIAVPLIVLATAAAIYLNGGRYVTTENAYVKADIVRIGTNIEGLITKVYVRENQQVERGDRLFDIDARLYRKQLAVTEADIEAAEQSIEALRSRYREGQAATVAAEERVIYLRSELKRQRELLGKGLGTQATLDAVEHDVRAAERRLAIQRQINQTVLAELGGDPNLPVKQHPKYLRAQAERELVLLNLSYSRVVAPVTGTITRVELKRGEYVEAGDLLLAIVDGSAPWVEANLKEVDLEHVRVGLPATVVLDSLPDIAWAATVESIAPSTGAEFSILPPQNASGNWVKVVQRVPVRLSITDRSALERFRAGLTATVSIDTGRERDLGLLFNRVFAGTHER
jgi:membrane fusion protein (multidrug efflux system)